jgi:hypothetical protein
METLIPGYGKHDDGDLVFLLFDNAHDIYWDVELWDQFFKTVSSSVYHVVLFCSCGSPSITSVTYNHRTPTRLPATRRVSLVPVQHDDGLGTVGLLLNRVEFDEVVSQYNKDLQIDDGLREEIFEWTAGHVGAVVDILTIIVQHVCILIQ